MKLMAIVAALMTAAGNVSAQMAGSIECQILRNQVIQAYSNSAPALSQEELVRQRAAEFARLTPDQQLAQAQSRMSANAGQGLLAAMGVGSNDPRSKEALLQKYKSFCE